MPVFHVYLNGKKVSTAGVGDIGVLSAHVTWVRRTQQDMQGKMPEEELTLHVGGLISPKEEYVRWLDRPLRVGDEVRITSPKLRNLTGHAAASGATPPRTCADRSVTSEKWQSD